MNILYLIWHSKVELITVITTNRKSAIKYRSADNTLVHTRAAAALPLGSFGIEVWVGTDIIPRRSAGRSGRVVTLWLSLMLCRCWVVVTYRLALLHQSLLQNLHRLQTAYRRIRLAPHIKPEITADPCTKSRRIGSQTDYRQAHRQSSKHA